VTSVSGVPGGGTTRREVARDERTGAARRRPAPEQAAPRQAAPRQAAPKRAAQDRAARSDAETSLFSRYAHAYVTDRFGQQVTLLVAGAVTAAGDLGAEELRESGLDVSVEAIDDDQPVTRAAFAADPGLSRCRLGDLRTVSLAPRSYDIVQCTLLLERIRHAELVLDRLVGALKPGGLLLLQVRDRDCAAGFLDRVLPGWTRRLIWRKQRPGRPGPHPAVYERLASVRGVHSYALLRGLVVAERQPLGGLAGGLRAAPHGYLAAQKMVARLSRRHLTAAHEDLLYVLRKPENRFARIL
jgi:SAM-dependent methyltransferase